MPRKPRPGEIRFNTRPFADPEVAALKIVANAVEPYFDNRQSRGRALVTLKDAGNYITKLPKAEHEAPEWLAAAQALLLVAERGGPTMLACIGIMRAFDHPSSKTEL